LEEALAYYDSAGGLRCAFCGARGYEADTWCENESMTTAICRACVENLYEFVQSSPADSG